MSDSRSHFDSTQSLRVRTSLLLGMGVLLGALSLAFLADGNRTAQLRIFFLACAVGFPLVGFHILLVGRLVKKFTTLSDHARRKEDELGHRLKLQADEAERVTGELDALKSKLNAVEQELAVSR